jgi:UDP-2-acetamido-2,6-beta-L-arabino-hexul-4-ose reductase
MKNVLITGSEGFIGRNLRQHLSERADIQLMLFDREQHISELSSMVGEADVIFHLAGINRPKDPSEFVSGNVELTSELLSLIESQINAKNHKIPLVLTSSIQASVDNAYGNSKRNAEELVFEFSERTDCEVFVFRLPNVFGKWCRPNYNSAVATFCHNIARDMTIQINDPNASLHLIYIDDLVSHFIRILDGLSCERDSFGFVKLETIYSTTVGEVASMIESFKQSRATMITERVGVGLMRALHATYLSYLPKESFSYAVPRHGDARGLFVEMLKTKDSGQFSFFTAHPGITRGGHYHHSKTEKFLVIKGSAKFKFEHVMSGETHEIITDGTQSQIVETVPGWSHDITNIGQDELIVMLWANEIFDRDNPDTYARPL